MIKNNLKLLLVLLSLFFLLIISSLVVAFGKTGQRIQVLGVDYSILNKKQIETKLKQDFILPDSLTLVYQKQSFNLNLATISAQVDTSQTASNMLFRRLNQGPIKYIQSFFSPRDFRLEVIYDDNSLNQFLSQISSQIDKPFIPTELVKQDDLHINVKAGELGLAVDNQKLKQIILDSLSYYQIANQIQIPTKIIGSLPTADKVEIASVYAQKLIGKAIILKGSGEPIVIDDKTLISWLDFNLSGRSDKINDYVDALKTNIVKEPVNAVFRLENNKVLEFKPSQDGYTVDDNQLKNIISRRFSDLASSQESSLNIDLPLTTIPPKVKTSDVNNLGIKELLGTGVSTFKHSDANRNYNIQKGASLVNSILVAPNETFSFIKNLGDVTLQAGFKNGYIIREGKTELDVGGGVCQVSTTLFRAMLNAGLDIISRQPHAYRVSYYEEDSPPGYDATVFVPNPDLKFVNDTGSYLLIQNTYDGVNKKLVYEIYGTSDGRKAKIDNYKKWDATPAPATQYIDDPSLPAGKLVQTEHAIPGLKTSFDWVVTDKFGNVLHQKTFQSAYAAWAAVYRRGTKI